MASSSAPVNAQPRTTAPRADVTQMPFAKLYPLLVNKAEKKGRTRQEVDQVTAWLTGYSAEDIARLEQSGISYGDFFQNAPTPPTPTAPFLPAPSAASGWRKSRTR